MSFTSLLGFQSDAGAWLRALAVLHALEAALGTADGHALNAALNACAGSGHWAAALALLLRLKGARIGQTWGSGELGGRKRQVGLFRGFLLRVTPSRMGHKMHPVVYSWF